MEKQIDIKEKLDMVYEDLKELREYWINDNLANVSLLDWDKEIKRMVRFMDKFIVDEVKEVIDYLGDKNEKV